MKKYFPIICLVVYLFVFSNPLAAQQDSIDNFVNAKMQKRKIPGLQLAVVQNGRIVKTAHYGFANVQDSIPVSDKTVFPINSITKAFTGVAIMQLVEAGKLTLSSPVSAYLPGLPKAWNTVTVLQLLSHTSGIPEIDGEDFDEKNAWKKVIALPMDFPAGEKFSYNQTNYLLLGGVAKATHYFKDETFMSIEPLVENLLLFQFSHRACSLYG